MCEALGFIPRTRGKRRKARDLADIKEKWVHLRGKKRGIIDVCFLFLLFWYFDITSCLLGFPTGH
jgi:hypothetical protein